MEGADRRLVEIDDFEVDVGHLLGVGEQNAGVEVVLPEDVLPWLPHLLQVATIIHCEVAGGTVSTHSEAVETSGIYALILTTMRWLRLPARRESSRKASQIVAEDLLACQKSVHSRINFLHGVEAVASE